MTGRDITILTSLKIHQWQLPSQTLSIIFLYTFRILSRFAEPTSSADYPISSERMSLSDSQRILAELAYPPDTPRQRTTFRTAAVLTPNPSLKRSANGMSRWPSSAGPAAHFALAVQRAMPLAPA